MGGGTEPLHGAKQAGHLGGEALGRQCLDGERRLDAGYGVKTKYIREVPDDHPVGNFRLTIGSRSFDQLKSLESLPRRAGSSRHSVTGMGLSTEDVGTGISRLFQC